MSNAGTGMGAVHYLKYVFEFMINTTPTTSKSVFRHISKEMILKNNNFPT